LDSSSHGQHYKSLLYHINSNGKNHPPIAMRRDGHDDRSSMMLSNSDSTGNYPSRVAGGGGREGYSLDQYSQDASETTGRYSECTSSSYSTSTGVDPPPYHQPIHPWRHHK
jgi:hypothetical protein